LGITMVLKKSKFGGNTGNTIRRCGKATKALRTASFISSDNIQEDVDERMDNNDLKLHTRNDNMDTTTTKRASKNNNSNNNSNSKKWLIPDRIKLEVQTESQKENAKLLKTRQQEMKKSVGGGRARIAVVDKLLDLGELSGKTNEERMNSFMNCVEEKYKKKMNRCKVQQNPSPAKDSTDAAADNNENKEKEQYRKVPNRCSKKFDDFTDEFYDDGKDDYASEKMSEEEDAGGEEINTRKAMTLAMFIKPKGKKNTPQGKPKHAGEVAAVPEIEQEGQYIIIEKPQEILEIMSALDASEQDFDITYSLGNGEEEFEIANPIAEDFEIADAVDEKPEKFVITGDVPVEEFEFTDERDAEDISDVEIEVEDSFIYLLYGSAWPSL